MSDNKNDSHLLTSIPRTNHKISRQSISEAALKVLYRLDQSGHRACLVGGGVRDLLLGRQPKDFDVATDATPEQVRELFRNSRIIGRRFRLVHIRFGREIIEVATFRGYAASSAKSECNTEGRILRDNTFGVIEEDAIRRDFTVNALYYDIHDFSILDYANGFKDIEAKRLCMIGDTRTRYQEDPVRMLRAVRFAAKLDFELEAETAEAIFECAPLLNGIPTARLFDETVKLFHSGNAVRVFELLRHFGLLSFLFPALDTWIKHEPTADMLDFIDQALVNTDFRVNNQLSVSPAFMFAILLWPVVYQRALKLQTEAMLKIIPALEQVGASVIAQQIKHTAVPRRYTHMCRAIWSSQPRFRHLKGKSPFRLLDGSGFRAAYDFMCIQTKVGLMPTYLCSWWTEFQVSRKLTAPRRGRNRCAMSFETVYVGIGSNMGDSPVTVRQAIACLSALSETKLEKQSSLYRTEPISDIPQSDYINAVVRLETKLQPTALLRELQAIEQTFHRQRDPALKWAPRTLDLDIILFGTHCIHNSYLTVPHPEMHNRLFVLQPLFEIEGDIHIPTLGNLQHLIKCAPDMKITVF